MSITSRICDFCGKDIKPYGEYSWLKFSDKTYVCKDGSRYAQDFYYIDMCDECAKTVFDKIREMKKNSGK